MDKPRRVRLKPADPFDLIRLLARSQNDPRKAVAELVQNSLDAGATDVGVTRYRKGGLVCLSIRDNGGGVLPAMARPDALHHIATHIGHSYKQHLTPEQRYRLLQQGKYGIGLLGFWSIGRAMSIRSRVDGSEVFALQLEEDEPEGLVGPERGQRALDPTWTEVVIRDLHPAALRLVGGRKLAEYLAFELRGQILQRSVHLRVVDKLARGRAQQDFPVRPPRFQGIPWADVREWPVAGHPPIRVELYYLPEEHGTGRVTLACAGTTVADDLPQLEAVDLRYAPWDGGRLTGLLDAPFLDVAPGTRRGIVPNAKAEAFGEAARALADAARGWMASQEQVLAREEDRSLYRRLRTVFRELHRRLPHYDLFAVPDAGGRIGAAADAAAGAPMPRDPAEAAALDEGETEAADLFQPGPLAGARIVPGNCRLPVGAAKAFRARAVDAGGRPIREGARFAWSLASGPGRLAPLPCGPQEAGSPGSGGTDLTSPAVLFHADAPGRSRILLEAVQGDRRAQGEAAVEIRESLEPPEREGSGIPEPVQVKDPTGRWRSRLREGKWEFNGSHPDYLLAARDLQKRLRYLAALLAKELVLRQVAGGSMEDRLLESLVEVLAALEDRLGRPGRKGEAR